MGVVNNRIEAIQPSVMVERYCSPWQGAESDYPDLFGKYGYTVTGIYEKWHWYNDSDIDMLGSTKYSTLASVTQEEAYRMVAIAHIYWQPSQDKLSEEYQEYQRLDMIRRFFINHPEQRAIYFNDCPQEKKAYYKRFPEEKHLYEGK